MSKNISIAAGAIASIIIAQTAGIVGSIFTAPSIKTWYEFLEKPFFSPPNWLFAPAWVLLYTLMGIAAFLVWRKKENPARKETLELYILNLILNAFWSVLFFGLKNPGIAFFEIMTLWIVILIVMMKFFKIEKTAGILFIPYILWVTFAAILNLAVWRLNL